MNLYLCLTRYIYIYIYISKKKQTLMGKKGIIAITDGYNIMWSCTYSMYRSWCVQCWEAWMVELVSVACLSIACKLDEVNIPSLHHLQVRVRRRYITLHYMHASTCTCHDAVRESCLIRHSRVVCMHDPIHAEQQCRRSAFIVEHARTTIMHLSQFI